MCEMIGKPASHQTTTDDDPGMGRQNRGHYFILRHEDITDSLRFIKIFHRERSIRLDRLIIQMYNC